MNSKFGIAIIVVGFLAFTVGTARPACAAPPTNACSLLTPAQVSAAVGASVGAGTPLFPTDTKVCQWRTTSAQAKIRVQLFLKDARAFAYAKMPVQGITKVAAGGIGDDAVYSTGPVLSVKKGDISFNVHVLSYGLPDEKAKAMEKALALDVLKKL